MTDIPPAVRAEVLRDEVDRLRTGPPEVRRKPGITDAEWFAAVANFQFGFIAAIQQVMDHALALDPVPDDISELGEL